MILDYRIWCTIWAVYVLLYCASGPYFYWKHWSKAWIIVLGLGLILGLANFLDWIWS